MEKAQGVDVGALSTRLRFSPQDGCIWLEGERMVLLHQAALASLRRELVDALGMEAARGILMRFGQVSGATDAAIALRAKPDADITEAFQAGPRLHAIEGIAASDPVGYTLDPATNFYAGEWIWRNSVEAEAHLREFRVSAEPVCWMALGYAAAYTSAFMGRPIIYREVECRGAGASQCRIVGKLPEDWGVDDEAASPLEFPALADRRDPVQEWTGVDPAVSDPAFPLIGESPGFMAVVAAIKKVAQTEAAVIFIGEAGTGKNSFARCLHQLSARSAKPLMRFHCGAYTGERLEAELFGVERRGAGSAEGGRMGRLERANGGSLYLEDIDQLDDQAQAKLFQALRDGEVERVGGTQPRPINARIIASANEGLIDAVREGRFREDLYYKLAVFQIPVPPLRERRSDLPLLTRHFVEKFSRSHKRAVKGFSEAGIAFLSTHDFRGNIAELSSMIERAVIGVTEQGILDVVAIAAPIEPAPLFLGLSNAGQLIPRAASNKSQWLDAADTLLEDDFDLGIFENALISRAVERAEGNMSRAARALGLTRAQLAYRFRKQGE